METIYYSTFRDDWIGLLATMLFEKPAMEEFVSIRKAKLNEESLPLDCWYDPGALIDLSAAIAAEKRSGMDDAQRLLTNRCSSWRLPYTSIAMVDWVAGFRFVLILDLPEMIGSTYPLPNIERTDAHMLDYVEANVIAYDRSFTTEAMGMPFTPFVWTQKKIDQPRRLAAHWAITSGLAILEDIWKSGPDDAYRAQFVNLVALIEAVVLGTPELEAIERIAGVAPRVEAWRTRWSGPPSAAAGLSRDKH